MKTKMTDLAEHLFEMAERLLDDDLCKDEETTKREIEKSNTMVNLAGAIVNVKQVEMQQVELELKTAKVANSLGFTYTPKKIAEEGTSKKKLLPDMY